MTKTSFQRRSGAGFTLIELMIAVAIVGILTSLAYPSYMQSVRKSRRAEAKTALLDLAQREERYRSTANTYTADPTALGYPAGAKFPLPVLTGNTPYYNLVFPSAPTTSTFTATAVPLATGNQNTDPCGTYTLTETGAQSVSNPAISVGDCW